MLSEDVEAACGGLNGIKTKLGKDYSKVEIVVAVIIGIIIFLAALPITERAGI